MVFLSLTIRPRIGSHTDWHGRLLVSALFARTGICLPGLAAIVRENIVSRDSLKSQWSRPVLRPYWPVALSCCIENGYCGQIQRGHEPSEARFISSRVKLSRMERNKAGSEPLSTQIIAPPGSLMWIVPPLAVGSSTDRCGSLGPEIVTGSSAQGSTSSPRTKARRHLNTWLAFTP